MPPEDKTTANNTGSDVIDFNTKRAEKLNSTEQVKNLISQGKITEAINNLSEPIPVDTLEYLYDKASDFFNAGKIEDSKTIFLKIANIKDYRINAETKYYVDNSNFNLGIIYTMENNPELGYRYGNRLILHMFELKFAIQFLLATYNNYQKFKNGFKDLNKEFSAPELKNLMKFFWAIRKENVRLFADDKDGIRAFTEKHFVLIEKIIGQEKFKNKGLLAKIERLAFDFEYILSSANAILLGGGSLELNFIDQIKFNKIDLEKNQDYYIEQLHSYLEKKITEVRKDGYYVTTRDEYKEKSLFEFVQQKIKTEQASDLGILYAFLKKGVFFSKPFLVKAIIELMEEHKKNIIFPKTIEKKLSELICDSQDLI